MSKLALLVFLLSALNPGADVTLDGNEITMDYHTGKPVVMIVQTEDGEFQLFQKINPILSDDPPHITIEP